MRFERAYHNFAVQVGGVENGDEPWIQYGFNLVGDQDCRSGLLIADHYRGRFSTMGNPFVRGFGGANEIGVLIANCQDITFTLSSIQNFKNFVVDATIPRLVYRVNDGVVSTKAHGTSTNIECWLHSHVPAPGGVGIQIKEGDNWTLNGSSQSGHGNTAPLLDLSGYVNTLTIGNMYLESGPLKRDDGPDLVYHNEIVTDENTTGRFLLLEVHASTIAAHFDLRNGTWKTLQAQANQSSISIRNHCRLILDEEPKGGVHVYDNAQYGVLSKLFFEA